MTQEDHEQERQRTTQEEERIVHWRCLNCGQTHFTHPAEKPPDICDYCRDMTTWERVPIPTDRSQRPD